MTITLQFVLLAGALISFAVAAFSQKQPPRVNLIPLGLLFLTLLLWVH